MSSAWQDDASISKEPSASSDRAQPKKPRHRHSAHQLQLLNELYDRDEHPSLDERTQLAQRFNNLSANSVTCMCQLLIRDVQDTGTFVSWTTLCEVRIGVLFRF